MALGRLTSFTFGNSFLTLVYANSQTYYVSYAHIIAGESDSRSGDLTIWIYTAGEVGETLSVKNSDLVAIGSSATAFLALFNQNIQPYSYWQDFLDSTTASGALPSEPSALRGQCLYARFRPIYNFGSASLINVPARFKAGTLYSQVPDTGAGDFTVTRATTPTAGRSTRINKDGLIELVANNVPRLDYPLDGGCPALLVEPSAQNLVQRSEEFNDAYWTKISTMASGNVTTSPDGTLTADKIIENANTDLHYVRRLFALSGTYAISVYAKAAERDRIWVGSVSTGRYTIFDLTNGTVVTQVGISDSQITKLKDGWYRCAVIDTINLTAFLSYGIVSGTNRTYSGDGTSGVFLWGAQLEIGSVATSYIPTATAAVTRSADVISRTSASALIGQTEGTIYIECQSEFATNDIIVINTAGQSPGNNYVSITKTPTNVFRLTLIASGTTILIDQTSAITSFAKIAVAYASGNTALFINGTQIGSTDTTSFSFNAALNNITFISNMVSGTKTTRIRAAAICPNRLTNAQLAALTAP